MKRIFLSSLAGLGLLAWSAQARINVTSLPGRDTVQLTIYNSADLTLVKETRILTFKKGFNRLEFSWANTLIDPTSVEFRPLTHPDQVEVLDVRFPPRVTNTLEWRIESEFAGEVKTEIRYFTSGISWSADYVVEADAMEKLMTLAGNVRVNNQSGEDYEGAQIRLVVGVVHLVEKIADLARQKQPPAPQSPTIWGAAEAEDKARAMKEMARAAAQAGARPAAIVKEALSEYFLYTVGGRDTVKTGWAKRLPSFNAAGVPITSYYKYEKERYGNLVVRFYKFKNDQPSKLGREPLPDGAVMAFRTVTDDGLYAFVGRTRVKYIPVDEAVELELGPDPEVRVEPKLMDWQKVDISFNSSGNVAADSSGNKNHGTLRGDPTWTTGKIGGALYFDGSGDDVVANNVPVNTDPGAHNTVTFWLKWDYMRIAF